MTQRVPSTPLPNPGDNSEEAHAQISQRFSEHADIELQKRHRLQASEKVWAMVAHRLKAVAKNRGWESDSHGDVRYIAQQLSRETNDPDLMDKYGAVENLHYNFYENKKISLPEIRRTKEQAEGLVEKLEAIRQKPPAPYTITAQVTDNIGTTDNGKADQERIADLLGLRINRPLRNLLPVGLTSREGFSPNYGYIRPPGRPKRNQDADDGDTGTGGDPARLTPPQGPGSGGEQVSQQPRPMLPEVDIYHVDPQRLREALPEVAELLSKIEGPSEAQPGYAVLTGLTVRERSFHSQELDRILSRYKTLTVAEAIKGLEHGTNLLAENDFTPKPALRKELLRLVTQATGIRPRKTGQPVEQALGDGIPSRVVPVVRGIDLHLTWEFKLVKVTLDPEQWRLRSQALSIIGMGQGHEVPDDLAENHDDYIVELAENGQRGLGMPGRVAI